MFELFSSRSRGQKVEKLGESISSMIQPVSIASHRISRVPSENEKLISIDDVYIVLIVSSSQSALELNHRVIVDFGAGEPLKILNGVFEGRDITDRVHIEQKRDAVFDPELHNVRAAHRSGR